MLQEIIKSYAFALSPSMLNDALQTVASLPFLTASFSTSPNKM
jgi:hypothetical protein